MGTLIRTIKSMRGTRAFKMTAFLLVVSIAIIAQKAYAYSAPSNSLTVSPQVILVGQSAILTYASSNGSQAITSASIDNGVGSVAGNTSGTKSVSPAVTTTYTFTINDGRTTLTKSVTVYVSSGAQTGVTAQTSASISGGIAVPNATGVGINWNTEDFDDLNWHSTAVNPTRITVSQSGRYQIRAQVCFNTINGGGFAIDVYKNGVPQNHNHSFVGAYGPASGVSAQCVGTNLTANLANGDYLEVGAAQWTGGTVYIQPAGTFFQVDRE